jgi:hypothetical protein
VEELEGLIIAAALEQAIADVRDDVGEKWMDEDGIRERWRTASRNELGNLVGDILDHVKVFRRTAQIQYWWKSTPLQEE